MDACLAGLGLVGDAQKNRTMACDKRQCRLT